MLGDRTVRILGSSRELDRTWDRVESIDRVEADEVVVLDRPDEAGRRTALRRVEADRIVVVVRDRAGLKRALAAGATDVVVAGDDVAAAVERRLSATADRSEPDESVVATLRAGYGGTLRVTDGWTVTAATGTAPELLNADAEGRHLWRTTETVDGTAAWRLRATLCDGQPRHLTWTVGDRRLAGLAVGTAEGLLVGVRDASRNARVETERDRLENLFATIDDGIYTVDADLRIQSVNDAVTTVTGYERSQLVGEHSSMLATDETLTDAAAAIHELRTTDREVKLIEGELKRADGSRLPIETRFSTTTDESGRPVYVGVFRDVTDRRRYEETLEALNRAAQSLLAATEEYEVWEQLVTTAREVLSLPTTAAYCFDETETVLRPVACCGGRTCDPPTLEPGSTGWQQFVDGHRRLTATATLTDRDRRTLFLPVADHGMLVVELPPGMDDPKKLTALLVADGTAALDRLDRESRLSSHEAELATRAAELERVNRFNELVRDLNAALVDATTRAEIETAVCDRLVATDGIELAWIGTPDERRVVAGDDGYLETALADPSLPGVAAAKTGEPVVVSNAAQRLRDADWAERAVRHGFRAVSAVPLSTHGTDHGVLSLYGSESGLFDEPVWETLAEFGGTIAAAIDHVETRTALASDAATEVGVRIESDEPPLARLASTLDAPVELASATPLENGAQLCVHVDSAAVSITPDDPKNATDGPRTVTNSPGTATDAGTTTDDPRNVRDNPEEATDDAKNATDGSGSIDAVAAAAERLPVVRTANPVGSDTLAVRVVGRTVPTTLATHGAATTDLRATETTLRATIELPPDAGVRSFLTSVRETYPSTTITARQSRDESSRLPAAFYQQAARRLTDRQLDVLRTSHAMGYFAWPRDATGAEIADSLEIAQPTFSKHLRVAQRKLLTLFFNRGTE